MSRKFKAHVIRVLEDDPDGVNEGVWNLLIDMLAETDGENAAREVANMSDCTDGCYYITANED